MILLTQSIYQSNAHSLPNSIFRQTFIPSHKHIFNCHILASFPPESYSRLISRILSVISDSSDQCWLAGCCTDVLTLLSRNPWIVDLKCIMQIGTKYNLKWCVMEAFKLQVGQCRFLCKIIGNLK